MSLTWDVENVKDYESTCFYTDDECAEGERKLNPITNALIWHTLSIGIGQFTEKNAAKIYARIAIVEKLDGPSLRNADGPRAITPEDVQAHIGMWTNVGDITDAQFKKRVIDDVLSRNEREYERAVKKASVPA